MSHLSLTNHFLIAMPALDDPKFRHTVTYICEHNEQGAMGIVINRPLKTQLDEVFMHMGISSDDPIINHQPVFNGGPVQPERGFVIHSPSGKWESSLVVTDEISVAASKDILIAMAHNDGPEQSLVALGYAGWDAGQLENELIDNTWLHGPSSKEILFSTDSKDRWEASAALLGIDVNLISSQTGHT
jgi:putative transcriptional regulator